MDIDSACRAQPRFSPSRRAKAKLLDGKKIRHLGGSEWSDAAPDTPPQLSAGFEADLHSLIHEDHREPKSYLVLIALA